MKSVRSNAFMKDRDESLGSRLRVMVELAPGMTNVSAHILSARLRRIGHHLDVSVIQGHLDGTANPSNADKSAYAQVCQWHGNTSLLANEPEVYLLPLVQAEILLSIRLIGMPQSRGPNGLAPLERMSVRELRRYRANLLQHRRPHLVA